MVAKLLILYKRLFLLFFKLLFIGNALTIAQQKTDSLHSVITANREDSFKVNALNDLAYANLYSKPDSCYYYAAKALALSEKINYHEGIIISQQNIAFTFIIVGNYSKALSLLLETLKMSETIHYTKGKELAFVGLASVYGFQNDERKSIEYNLKGIERAKLINDNYWIRAALSNLSISYMELGMLDSAIHYTDLVNKEYELANDKMGIARSLGILASIHSKKENYPLALAYLRKSLDNLNDEGNTYLLPNTYEQLAGVFKKQNNNDSVVYYAMLSWQVANDMGLLAGKISAANFLYQYYKEKNSTDSAFKYLEINMQLKDSAFTEEKDKDFQSLTIAENMRQLQIQQAEAKAQQEYNTRLKLYGLISGLVITIIIAALLFRNAKQQKVSKTKIEKAYDELKSTQSQLIQSEKMASLGELTAGIAHEIQNPLNFVNNFSEVSNELIDEMKIELDKGDVSEAKIIADDIKQNLEKINHHGKRADAIVKGMLQHSRSSNAAKESTDINKLADEYLRLAYHGLRAKDSNFNAALITDFDGSIGNISIIPQDIGRVILNLITNAFYAAAAKKKTVQNGFEPTVWVSTKLIGNKIQIIVKDNGNGIPQKIVDKIFQPFFTTKPTGQGTGLGLSLSYDIIKAHGGELTAETKEGEYAAFVITLPK